MPFDNASRETTNPTLADVLTAIAQSNSPRRRADDMASAVRVICRLFQRTPDAVPADPRLLAARLSEIAPAAHQLSPRRWNNIRSLVRSAVALVTTVSPGRHSNPLAPGWLSLWEGLQSRSMRTRLSRFLHFCSAAGIEPSKVTATTFEAFRASIGASLIKDPETAYRDMVSAWVRTRRENALWPQIEIAVPTRRQSWTLPWSAFPETFEKDVRDWLERIGGKDPFADMPMRPVREGTIATREYQLRQFASALVRAGRDASSICTLSDLTAIDAWKAGLRFMLGRCKDPKNATTVAQMATMLKGVARHWVRVDDRHLAQMTAIISRIDVPPRGLTEKNRQRLRPLSDPETVQAFLNLPKHLIQFAAREPRATRAALLAQTATAIEILHMAPIRIGNLAALDFDRNLARPAKGQLHIVLQEGEVKNNQDLEFPLPASSVALVDLYVKKYRPVLAEHGSTALFPGRAGGAKSVAQLRHQITRTVFTFLGLRVNPHWFRHAGGFIHLQANPGSYEVVRRVLGHKKMDTTTAFYTGLESAAAVRHFDKTILKLRKGRRDD